MGRPRIHHLPDDQVVSAYLDGASINSLATQHGVDRYVVRRVLADNNVDLGGRTLIALPSHNHDALPAGYITGPDLAVRAGITYRQLDYWCRTGYLQPVEPTPGSGYLRAFPLAEVALARLVRDLLEAGMQPRPAFALARDLLEHGHAEIAGIRIDLPQDL